MSKRESFLRYTIIIKVIQQGNATFDEISDHLDRESELQDYDLRISKRTFQRDLDEIRSLFNVDIQFDFSKKVYFISDDSRSDANNRMLEAFDMFNALNISEDLASFIHFEKRKPQGTGHFYGLLHCIKNRFVVKFPYWKFEDDVVVDRTVDPYLLKEFKNRWYLLAKDQYDDRVKTFGLDRIQELEITKKRFQWPSDFKSNEMFKNCFGIISPNGKKPQEITLSFDPLQGKYIKTFPLHESQELLADNKTETRVKLNLHVTYDFVMELLSYGERVKVISPKSLSKELCKNYSNALQRYKARAKY